MMITYLYPQIQKSAAGMIARELQNLTVAELVDRSSTEDSGSRYEPTGGSRVDSGRLDGIRRQIRMCAGKYGYPSQIDASSITKFDSEAAEILYREMQIAPNEAAHGIWEFISCILMPDIVRFRFPGRDRTILERFLGGPRNTFGRLWWRAFIFRDDTESDNLTLLKQLKEDEIGQIMERRAICGNRRLVNRICRGFLESNRKYSISNRMELMRDAQKRILRLSSFISFDAIDDGQLARIIEKVFESSVAALK